MDTPSPRPSNHPRHNMFEGNPISKFMASPPNFSIFHRIFPQSQPSNVSRTMLQGWLLLEHPQLGLLARPQRADGAWRPGPLCDAAAEGRLEDLRPVGGLGWPQKWEFSSKRMISVRFLRVSKFFVLGYGACKHMWMGTRKCFKFRTQHVWPVLVDFTEGHAKRS